MLTAFLVAVAGLKILRPMAPSRTFNGRILRELERATGYAVAMTAYCDPARIPSLIRRRRAPRAGPRPRHRGRTIAQGWESGNSERPNIEPLIHAELAGQAALP